jgi:2-(1,2-epoxy-1,2-dihydrophenyl)acetyl-CoA isomerase
MAELVDTPTTTGIEAEIEIAGRLYRALADGDRAELDALLDPAFSGVAADGMPFGIGGGHDSPKAMLRDFWGQIARHFTARAVPDRFLPAGAGRILVTGRYTGTSRETGGTLDAAFAHLIDIAGGRIIRLEQFTDTARWAAAAAPRAADPQRADAGGTATVHAGEPATVTCEVSGGVATIRLNRPATGNAFDEAMAAELRGVSARLPADRSVRAVLVTGNGRAFTVGGDLRMLARTPADEVPRTLGRMIGDYHVAIEQLSALDVPVVAAVRGAAGGGGLGLLCCADIVVAAQDARFALGYAALGLTADGGTSWYLPRLVGLRRAQELFLLNRRLTAAEALDYGLVTRVVPPDEMEPAAAAIAATLAAGPTAAFGGMRGLLRRSFETGLRDQLAAEYGSMMAASATADAAEGIGAFGTGRRPAFHRH